MQLSEVVDTHRRVTNEPGRDRKAELMADLLGRASEEEVAVVAGFLAGQLRQGRIGVGPALLRSVVAGIRHEDADDHAQPLDVLEVDAALSALAAETGAGSRDRKAEQLRALLVRSGPEERRFLQALVLGGLRQGAGEGVLLDAIARAAGSSTESVRRDMLRLGGADAVAERQLTKTADSDAEDARLVLFRPLAPMLAGSTDDTGSAIDAFPRAIVEAKADGARVQVHRRAGEVRVFTRRLNDITPAVPEIVAATERLSGGDLVLDGEALGWAHDRPMPFQTTMRRIGAGRATSELRERIPLRIFWFDCLFADHDLLDRPFGERRAVLTDRVPRDVLLPSRIVSTGEPLDGAVGEQPDAEDAIDDEAGLAAFMDQVRRAGFEGLIVKDLDAPYRAGRRGGAWLKLKPVQTLDLVVLAAEWGSGRRRGWLSNLHLGARGEAPGEWVMLGKTFKGMTDELLAWQTEALQEIEARRDEHVVFVRPEKVVEVAFEGVQRSRRYDGGVSLRFARLRGYREDKSPADADTIETVRALLPEGAAEPTPSPARTRRGARKGRRGGAGSSAQRDLFADDAEADAEADYAADTAPAPRTSSDPGPGPDDG